MPSHHPAKLNRLAENKNVPRTHNPKSAMTLLITRQQEPIYKGGLGAAEQQRRNSGNVDSEFIRQLNIHSLPLFSNIGGQSLKHDITSKQRKELETKMAKIFKENIKELSTELQRILLDDLVTAFQNRINVLNRAQKKRSY